MTAEEEDEFLRRNMHNFVTLDDEFLNETLAQKRFRYCNALARLESYLLLMKRKEIGSIESKFKLLTLDISFHQKRLCYMIELDKMGYGVIEKGTDSEPKQQTSVASSTVSDSQVDIQQ